MKREMERTIVLVSHRENQDMRMVDRVYSVENGRIELMKDKESKMSAEKIQSKGSRKKEVVSLMIGLYCKRNIKQKACFVMSVKKLDDYAKLRSDKCPFMETKTFCSNCKVHCYKPEMREKIREVMRFSGPRMIFTIHILQ